MPICMDNHWFGVVLKQNIHTHDLRLVYNMTLGQRFGQMLLSCGNIPVGNIPVASCFYRFTHYDFPGFRSGALQLDLRGPTGED